MDLTVKDEIEALKEQIRTENFEMTEKEKAESDRLKAEAKKAEEELNKLLEDFNNDPEAKEFKQLESDLSEKRDKLSKLGHFHKKEKNELQTQINAMSGRLDYLSDKFVALKDEAVKLDKKVESTKKQYEDYKSNVFKNKKITAENKLKLLEPKVGDEVLFGRYPQGTKGQIHSLHWIVIAKEDDQVLLLSKYGLEERPFNQEKVNITWKECDLREWLNGEFVNTAFRQDEYEKIAMNRNYNDPNPKYGTSSGDSTRDFVFCLSLNEVNKYLNESNIRCEPTSYAYGYKPQWGARAPYWLRTAGREQNSAVFVSRSGEIVVDGFEVISETVIRPALWMKLYNYSLSRHM